jgi:hypothetical protein
MYRNQRTSSPPKLYQEGTSCLNRYTLSPISSHVSSIRQPPPHFVHPHLPSISPPPWTPPQFVLRFLCRSPHLDPHLAAHPANRPVNRFDTHLTSSRPDCSNIAQTTISRSTPHTPIFDINSARNLLSIRMSASTNQHASQALKHVEALPLIRLMIIAPDNVYSECEITYNKCRLECSRFAEISSPSQGRLER